jgi:hypothetical protein
MYNIVLQTVCFFCKAFYNLDSAATKLLIAVPRILSIVCFSFLAVSFLPAQNYETRYILRGQIVDSVSGTGIAYVQIFNESTRMLMVSDTMGYFEINVKGNDSLVFLCLGYLGKVYIVRDFNTYRVQIIKLAPYPYPIEEVSISRYRDYNQFKHEFLLAEPKKRFEITGVPKPKYQDIPVLLDTNYIRSSEFLVFHPISFLYYNLSKEEKSKRKVYYLERQQREQVVIDKKYNRDLIEKMTGLTGEEITKFMWFCNFSHQFLYEASELEIIQKIDEKFREYTQAYHDGGTENTQPE